jgi:hypothetical protein
VAEIKDGDKYEYRGKCLSLCSREQLIACVVGQLREIRTTRRTRDQYLDETIKLRREIASLRDKVYARSRLANSA